ncbi:plasma membrane localization protein, partial [Coemansia sp. RSA 1933]
RYVKHATLIERCFPLEKTNNDVPNSNELSYLVYYAQSKPAKLTKVGAYLSKRVSRDAQKRRYADIRVALCILNDLLSACGSDLHFFAKDVLEALDTVLSANDLALSRASTHTFALFCQQHTGSTLAIDKELCSLYSRLVRTFASFAKKYDGKTTAGSSMTALGLCALQAVSESQATYAADCYYELPCVVKAIVACIARIPAPEVPVDSVSVYDRIDTIKVDTNSTPPSNTVLGSWAWNCLKTIVGNSHGQHSHVVVTEIVKQLDRSFKWRPVSLCVQIMTDVIGNLQPQDRNMVIVEILGLLTNSMHTSSLYLGGAIDSDADASKEPTSVQTSEEKKETNRRTCIIRILERLFCQPHVLVGISVMDVLNVLVTFLLESVIDKHLVGPDLCTFSAVLEAASTGSEFSIDRDHESPEAPSSNGYHLLAAIGGLARHHYYSNQMVDMVEYLVQQMQLGKLSEHSETEEQNRNSTRQHWLVQVLHTILVSGRVEQQKPVGAFLLPFKAFAPVFTLISHERQALRLQAADSLVYKQVAHLSLNDKAKTEIGAVVKRAKKSGVWSTDIEDVCTHKIRATSLGSSRSAREATKPATSDPGISGIDSSLSAFISKESVVDMLGADVAAQCEDTRARQESIGEDYWNADSEHVNRVLCNSGYVDMPAKETQNSAKQVRDIRARVSVDWEAQVRRDSILAPHVNVDQLRAALRDGLSIHSSDQLGDLGLGGDHRARRAMSNYNMTSTSGVGGNTVIGDEHGGDLDMHGQPVPDDVRDLLNSIDNNDYDDLSVVDEFPLYALSGGRRSREGSSTISTPVIGNVE